MYDSIFNEILHKNNLTEEDKLKINKAFEYFKLKFENSYSDVVIKKAGSVAKKIAVRKKLDLDILIVFPGGNGIGPKQVYLDTLDFLKVEGLRPSQGDAAIQCTYKKMKIDIVPAQWIDDTFMNIWRSRMKKKKRTSIDLQKKLIDDLGARNLFKLIKLWKISKKLIGPSFLYEIFTLRAIDAMDEKIWETGSLTYKLYEIFDYIHKTILKINLDDPTNSNNRISDLWDIKERNRVKSAAFDFIMMFQDEEEYELAKLFS
jgi:hypothetical protein